MSFRSRQTSLTNLSSVTERMEPFDSLVLDRNEVYYPQPHPPQRNCTIDHFKKGLIFVFVLVSICIQCYLLTTVTHLQSLVKEREDEVKEAMSVSKEGKLKIDNLKSLMNSNLNQGVSMENFPYKVNNEIENLKRLVHIQNTVVTNTDRNVNELKDRLKLNEFQYNTLERKLERSLLADGGFNNATYEDSKNSQQNLNASKINQNNQVDSWPSTLYHSNQTNTFVNWRILLNSSFERLDRLDEELNNLKQKTEQNSVFLHNAVINSNSEMFKLLSDNSSLGILADVDAIVLKLKNNIDKLKFSIPGKKNSNEH